MLLNYKATSIKDYNINSDTISTDIICLHNNHLVTAHNTAAMEKAVKEKTVKEKSDIQTAGNTTKKSTQKGIMYADNIQDNVHMFISYGIWMQRRTQDLEKKLFELEEEESKKKMKQPKAPFQVIPQLMMKLRFMKFGKEQIVE